MVEIIAVLNPASSKILATICAVVVFPLVPVIPITFIFRDGKPNQKLAKMAWIK